MSLLARSVAHVVLCRMIDRASYSPATAATASTSTNWSFHPSTVTSTRRYRSGAAAGIAATDATEMSWQSRFALVTGRAGEPYEPGVPQGSPRGQMIRSPADLHVDGVPDELAEPAQCGSLSAAQGHIHQAETSGSTLLRWRALLGLRGFKSHRLRSDQALLRVLAGGPALF
jgi:hypothetical protein